MRARIWVAALLVGAAACGDATTNPGTDGDGQTGLPGGKGQSGGGSTINPSVALASSVARDCPRRCGFALTNAPDPQSLGQSLDIGEDAGILLAAYDGTSIWRSGANAFLKVPAGYATLRASRRNGWGQVAGSSSTSSNPATGEAARGYATAWEPDGSGIVLSDRPYGPPLEGEARAINDNSVIVGVSGDRAFRTQYQEGFRWLSGAGSAPVDVNFAGQVVGYSVVGGNRHATVWAQNGTATDLGTLPGHAVSEAVAISETGIVVGFSRTSATSLDWRGFIWTASEGMKALEPEFIPADVNHWGEVAGRFNNTRECAVYYKGYGTLRMPRVVPTSIGCFATSINSWGDVGGYEVTSPNSGRTTYPRATVWTWGGNEGRYGF